MSAKSFYFESKQSEESDDRSSVSSIPWNSDAIKQNQMNWEQVERLLHFEEALPENLEPELRQEILDWQTKFPQLSKKVKRTNWTIPQTLNKSSLNNSSTNVSEILEFSSSFDDDESVQNVDNEFLETPKLAPARERFRFVSKRLADDGGTDARLELADVFGKDLHITPLTLRQRRSARLLEQRKSSTTSSLSDSPVPAKTIKYKNLQTEQVPLATNKTKNSTNTKSRYHMPPILNVLETKRRFCALNSNRSFVQLTQIQQAKSAAVHSTARQTLPERQYHHVWNKPLAAVTVNSRFLNNRHAIVLPALRQQHSTSTNSSDQSECIAAPGVTNRQFNNSFSNSNSSLSSGGIRGRQRIHMLHSNRQTTTTTSSGRSISAVPMHLHGAFYHL